MESCTLNFGDIYWESKCYVYSIIQYWIALLYAWYNSLCIIYIYQNEKLMKYIWSNPKTKIILQSKCRKNPVRNTQCLNSRIWYWSQSSSYLSFQSCCDVGASSATSKQITPWIFSLKHYIYVRWLPIILKEIHPSLYEKIKSGNLLS